MYYLRREPYKKYVPTGSADQPLREIEMADRAVFSHPKQYNFHIGIFRGIDKDYMGNKLYTCEFYMDALEVQRFIADNYRELFDIYDENGVNLIAMRGTGVTVVL